MSPIQQTLKTLSAAEDFFLTLGVPFEQSVVSVNRLHILKRFQVLLRALGEEADEAQCREALSQAYGEFAEGQGAKTFKVFKDANPGFVSLGELKPGKG